MIPSAGAARDMSVRRGRGEEGEVRRERLMAVVRKEKREEGVIYKYTHYI